MHPDGRVGSIYLKKDLQIEKECGIIRLVARNGMYGDLAKW